MPGRTSEATKRADQAPEESPAVLVVKVAGEAVAGPMVERPGAAPAEHPAEAAAACPGVAQGALPLAALAAKPAVASLLRAAVKKTAIARRRRNA